MSDVGDFVRWSSDIGGNTVSPDGFDLFNYICIFIYIIKDLEGKPKERGLIFTHI